MNPANDAGKRNLPDGLRSRFTEFWIDAPDSHLPDLLLIIKSYVHRFLPPGPSGEQICNDIASFYSKARDLSRGNCLFDGADQKVHISMRTLTRALSCAGHIAPVYGIRRSLYEGCFMTFMTGLGSNSFALLGQLLQENILNGVRHSSAFIRQVPPNPSGQADRFDSPYILIDTFWLEKGPNAVPDDIDSTFVLTPSVASNLRNLARGCLSRKYPILIQGPTSAGKTSIIEYLAKKTGHRFIRINNHEQTDLQEYLGGYMSNDEGNLVFQEGVLVEALRKGYWIVLDELNLAPSDVLEALNRLLDDNRELYLAEKQEVIKPHPHFMLFATQNPSGQYGGRKQLSRAFRNRFLELHFNDIPENELETIIERRCLIPPSYAKKLVAVFKSLSKSRDASRIFEGHQSFITLRDLFRWALRKAGSYEKLGEDGYMLIGERVRKAIDRALIAKIIEKELKIKLDISDLYEKQFSAIVNDLDLRLLGPNIVWTEAMKKLFVLIYNSIINYEPVLLIGETGCGKTTVCQVLALIFHQKIHIVNAHQNSETSDFLGSQRPARKRDEHELELRTRLDNHFRNQNVEFDWYSSSLLGVEKQLGKLMGKVEDKALLEGIEVLLQKAKSLFEWSDGPLIQAMKEGDMFLLDEISLADDSVLERLNSVLEPARQLTLVEKSGVDISEIKAADKFRFLATMNPGGDYGKKELSPALRNRFTEIWVPSVSHRQDLILILVNRLLSLGSEAETWATKLLDFVDWFAVKLNKTVVEIVSLRDLLAWAEFLNQMSSQMGTPHSFLHGGCMVLLDGIGMNPLFGLTAVDEELVMKSRHHLALMGGIESADDLNNLNIQETETSFGAAPFLIPYGKIDQKSLSFAFNAPTTLQNCLRVLRAMQFKKPILLEGSPGAGKTSLISSIAALCRYPLVRINLSEQTDLMDLFGSDLPVEGAEGGSFSWRDGPFLKAMQNGEWVILDELNLASQQVLEGLNACLDHRATVYIPELDRHFSCHPNFRVFGAQNPQSQGGGRKGLPKSFVNRFNLVYIKELLAEDLIFICQTLYPTVEKDLCLKMIKYNQEIKRHTMELRTFGWLGSPWEFNLRDLIRWLDLLTSAGYPASPEEFLDIMYIQRFRSLEDRDQALELFQTVFQCVKPCTILRLEVLPDSLCIGNVMVPRGNHRGRHSLGMPVDHLEVFQKDLPLIHSLSLCIMRNSPTLLIGPSASGKTSLVRLIASLCGQRLEEFSLNPGVDALELLGGFEQIDMVRKAQEILHLFEEELDSICIVLLTDAKYDVVTKLLYIWRETSSRPHQNGCFDEMLSLLLTFGESVSFSAIALKIKTFYKLLSSDSRGQFEWMDSVLVESLQKGYWLLIDNVNLCSASVLDRLNSLLEAGGTLAINERGLVDGEIQIITPHPNFRIFMTMDPKFGEISRAMRNRSTELYVTNFHLDQTDVILSSAKLLTSIGVPGGLFAKNICNSLGKKSLSIQNVKQIVECINRGFDWREVFPAYNLPKMEDLNLQSACMWPDRLRGIDTVRDSSLARVRVDGSILLQSLTGTDPYFFQPLTGINIPSAQHIQRAALVLFKRRHTSNDYPLRKAFLENLEIEDTLFRIENEKLISLRTQILSYFKLLIHSSYMVCRPINCVAF
jgi:midasin